MCSTLPAQTLISARNIAGFPTLVLSRSLGIGTLSASSSPAFCHLVSGCLLSRLRHSAVSCPASCYLVDEKFKCDADISFVGSDGSMMRGEGYKIVIFYQLRLLWRNDIIGNTIVIQVVIYKIDLCTYLRLSCSLVITVMMFNKAAFPSEFMSLASRFTIHSSHVNRELSKWLYSRVALQRIPRYNVHFPRSLFHVMENSRSGYNVLSL